MDASRLKSIVAEWLDEWEAPDVVPREIEEGPVRPRHLSRLSDILAVVGPRRAGKTFFMFQLIGELLEKKSCKREEILFVDFEDYRLSGMTVDDVDGLFVAFEQLAGRRPKYLFFDEVQHLPQYSRVLRTLHNKRKYRIVVSGSNSRLLSGQVATELRGRYRDLVMLPFSFRETLRFRGVDYNERTLYTASRGRLIRAFDEYLRDGGFPEVLREKTGKARIKLLQRYYRTVFYRDLLDRHNIKARSALEAVMGNALNGHATLFSISRMERQLRANDMAASKRTIANYLAYLQESFFTFAHEKYDRSMRKRTMNPKKIYLVDPGFAALAAGPADNRGRLLENLVAVELHRQQEEVYYHKGRHECDFVLVRKGRPAVAIQVCWHLDDGNIARECAGLREAMTTWKIRRGLILTYEQDEPVQWRGRSYRAIPAWRWLLQGE